MKQANVYGDAALCRIQGDIKITDRRYEELRRKERGFDHRCPFLAGICSQYSLGASRHLRSCLSTEPKHYNPTMATGVGVRLLIALLDR